MCVAYAVGNPQLVRAMGDTAQCLKAGFSFILCLANSPLHGKIAMVSTSSGVQKRSDTGLTAKKRVLILFYPPLSLVFHSLCCMAQVMPSVQKSKHSLRDAVYGFLPGSVPWKMCKKCRNLGKAFFSPMQLHFCSFPSTYAYFT